MMVIADFETYGKDTPDANKEPHDKMIICNTQYIMSHSFVVITGNRSERFKVYIGPDSDTEFLKDMLKLAEDYLARVSCYAEVMRMTSANWAHFHATNVCCICNDVISNDYEDEVANTNNSFAMSNATYQGSGKRKVRHHRHNHTQDVFEEQAKYIGLSTK